MMMMTRNNNDNKEDRRLKIWSWTRLIKMTTSKGQWWWWLKTNNNDRRSDFDKTTRGANNSDDDWKPLTRTNKATLTRLLKMKMTKDQWWYQGPMTNNNSSMTNQDAMTEDGQQCRLKIWLILTSLIKTNPVQHFQIFKVHSQAERNILRGLGVVTLQGKHVFLPPMQFFLGTSHYK